MGTLLKGPWAGEGVPVATVPGASPVPVAAHGDTNLPRWAMRVVASLFLLIAAIFLSAVTLALFSDVEPGDPYQYGSLSCASLQSEAKSVLWSLNTGANGNAAPGGETASNADDRLENLVAWSKHKDC